VQLIADDLVKRGFIKVSIGKSTGSHYFFKLGSHMKVRVADHKVIAAQSDVFWDIVIDSPTILADVEYRARQADIQYSNHLRNKRLAR